MTRFALTGPITLDVRLGHGSVTVTARADLTDATVTLAPQAGAEEHAERITVELRGGTLVVHAPRQGGLMGGPGRPFSSVDVEVAVPAGTRLKVGTFTADVILVGRSGDADIASGTGDITLDTVDGDLRLRYGAATSRVKVVTGSASVKSGSGNVLLGEVGGALDAGCGSGQLEAEVVRGRVRSRSGSGNAQLGEVHADVDLASGSGEFSIGLCEGTVARLDVKTGSGRLRSELPVDDAPAGKGPHITIRTRTGSGDVRIFRAA